MRGRTRVGIEAAESVTRCVLLSTGENRRAGPPAIVVGPAGILGFYAGEILNQVPGDSRRSRDGLVLG